MQSRRSVVFALLGVQVLFGTLPIAIKIALRDLSSPAVSLLRVGGAALLFLLLQRWLLAERVRTRADHGRLALYALFGVVLNQMLYITALTLTTATAAQTLVTVGPAFTLLVAILLRTETGSLGKWLGIALSAAGALLLVGVGIGAGGALGNVLVLLNVAAFSVYQVISRDMLKRYDPLTVITWVFVWGGAGLLPWGIAPVLRDTPGMGLPAGLALLWIVVGPTVGAYYLHSWALKRTESSTVAVYVCIQPVITALLAVQVLGERLPSLLVPSAVLIFIGVVATMRAGREPAPTGSASPPIQRAKTQGHPAPTPPCEPAGAS